MADATRWFPTADLMKFMPRAAVDALRRTHSNADTKGISKTLTVRDPDGVFDPVDETLVVQFFDNDVEIATCSIRGVMDVAGIFTLTETGSTGEETDVSFYGTVTNNTGDSVRAEVTHRKSKKTASASFSSMDLFVAGSIPTITAGGGDSEFPSGGGGGGMKMNFELSYQFDIINGRIEI